MLSQADSNHHKQNQKLLLLIQWHIELITQWNYLKLL